MYIFVYVYICICICICIYRVYTQYIVPLETNGLLPKQETEAVSPCVFLGFVKKHVSPTNIPNTQACSMLQHLCLGKLN